MIGPEKDCSPTQTEKPMVGYNGLHHRTRSHDARHPDGRVAVQVRACIQATNRKVVAAAIGSSVNYVADYWNKNLTTDMVEALSAHPPGTLLIGPLDPGGTIDGQSGWVKS